MDKLTGFFKKVVKVAAKPEMRILPGQFAFFFFLSIIPLVALIGAIVSSFSIPVSEVERINILPPTVLEFVLSVETYKGINFNLIVFFVTAFILASNGTHSMIITSNEIYKIEPNSYMKRRLKAIGMISILVVLLIFLMAVPVYGDNIFKIIKDYTDNQSLVDGLHTIFHIIKYPVTIIFLYLNIKLLYVMAPDQKIKAKTTTKGAIFTTVSWIISTEIYTIYINKFAVYDLFYGGISNIIVLLLWIYILSYLFVLGMALNVGLSKGKLKETQKIDLKEIGDKKVEKEK